MSVLGKRNCENTCELQPIIKQLEKDKALLVDALKSIANSTCCGDCQEASRVAGEAIKQCGGE